MRKKIGLIKMTSALFILFSISLTSVCVGASYNPRPMMSDTPARNITTYPGSQEQVVTDSQSLQAVPSINTTVISQGLISLDESALAPGEQGQPVIGSSHEITAGTKKWLTGDLDEDGSVTPSEREMVSCLVEKGFLAPSLEQGTEINSNAPNGNGNDYKYLTTVIDKLTCPGATSIAPKANLDKDGSWVIGDFNGDSTVSVGELDLVMSLVCAGLGDVNNLYMNAYANCLIGSGDRRINLCGPSPSNNSPSIISLTSDLSSPQGANSIVTWTAKASDPDGDMIYYKFLLKGSYTGNTWQDVNNGWTPSNTWIWRNSQRDIGQNWIMVQVRDGKHATPDKYDDLAQSTAYVIADNKPPEIISLTSDLSSPQGANSIVTWTAKASDPDGDTIYYKFLLRGSYTGNTWQDVNNGWTPSNTWIWRNSQRDIGQNWIMVQVRDGKHATPDKYDNLAQSTAYVITGSGPGPSPLNNPPSIISLTSDLQSPQGANSIVTWTAKASDPDGDTIYYKFLLKGPHTGNVWEDITNGWTTSNTWIWRNSQRDIGQSWIMVQVRDGKHAEGFDDQLMSDAYAIKQ